MREILFRGKRIDNGEWVQGDLINYTTGKVSIRNIETWETKDVDPATVGQYTGLKDKNGKEIYEGDICRYSYIGMDGKERSHTWVVEYENGLYWLRHIEGLKHYDSTLFLNFQKIEVIGNIHENPELLEGVDKCQP